MPVALLLPLAACSGEPATQPVANMAVANMANPAATAPASVAAAHVDDKAGAAPGEMKTFKDWVVACDNVKRCTMASLGPAAGDFPAYTMQVARAAGPAGGFEIAIDGIQDPAPAPAAILIDGRRFAVTPDGLAGQGAAGIVAAMANGRALSLMAAGGQPPGQVSLAGASAALRYIDAQQGRAGTVTATVAKGPQPAATVPTAPPVPVIRAPRIEGAAATPTRAQLAQMRRVATCDDQTAGKDWVVKTGAVGGGATLVLLPCSAGAYNEIDALFVLKDGKVTPAQVDSPAGFDETGADSQTPVNSVVNGDVEKGSVGSYAKGRGLGDCGVSQAYVWDGRRLRLTDQSEMNECRGNIGFLRTWVAKVERR
jgi:hypothetical protein